MRPAVISTNGFRDDWHSSYNQCTEECGKPAGQGYSDPAQPPCADANRPWGQSAATCMDSCIYECQKKKSGPLRGWAAFWELLWRGITRPGAEGGGMYQ